MKYWISIGGDIKGPYKPQELLGAPFFHPGMLVCPDTSLGENGEDWRCADAVGEIAFLMKGGSAAADRELAGEQPAEESDIDEESLPEAPAESVGSGEEEIKRYLSGLGISSASIPAVTDEEAESCSRASVSDTEISELEREEDELKSSVSAFRGRHPCPAVKPREDAPVPVLKLPRSLGPLEPAWLADLELNEVMQALSASSGNFTTKNDEEESTLALSELDFPVRRRLSPEYDEYEEEFPTRSARRRKVRRAVRHEDEYAEDEQRPLERWEEMPQPRQLQDEMSPEQFAQRPASVEEIPAAAQEPAAEQPLPEQIAAAETAPSETEASAGGAPEAASVPSAESAVPAEAVPPVAEPASAAPADAAPAGETQPLAQQPPQVEPAAASTESAISSRLNISETEAGELSGIGKVILPGGDTSGHGGTLPETSGINLGKLPDANISMRSAAMSTQSGRQPQKQPAPASKAKSVRQPQQFAAPSQGGQPGFGLPPVQSVPHRVNTFSQSGAQQRTSAGPNISQRSQASGLNIADTQSVRLSFPGGGAQGTLPSNAGGAAQQTSPQNTTASSKETAVVAGHIHAAQPTISAAPAKGRRKGLKPVVLFSLLGGFVIVAAVGIMILLKAVQKDETKEAQQTTADVTGKGDAKTGASAPGAASPFPQTAPKPVITPQAAQQEGQTQASGPAVPQSAAQVAATGAAPASRQGGQMSAVMVKATDIVKQHDLGGGKGTIEQWFQNSFQSADNMGLQSSWKAQLLNGDSYMVTYSYMRPRAEPLVYQFEVDVNKGVILRGVNNEARELFSGTQSQDDAAPVRRPRGAASQPVQGKQGAKAKQKAAAQNLSDDETALTPTVVKPVRKAKRKIVSEDVNDQLPLPEESPSDELE